MEAAGSTHAVHSIYWHTLITVLILLLLLLLLLPLPAHTLTRSQILLLVADHPNLINLSPRQVLTQQLHWIP
jgi:hypothetical protein